MSRKPASKVATLRGERQSSPFQRGVAYYATNLDGPAGIPACWIVDVRGRRVEVYTDPGPQGYGPPETVAEGQSVPVVIGGREVGRIAVEAILPPRRPGAKAEGDRARPRRPSSPVPSGRRRRSDRVDGPACGIPRPRSAWPARGSDSNGEKDNELAWEP
jgi:hypothetical protein